MISDHLDFVVRGWFGEFNDELQPLQQMPPKWPIWKMLIESIRSNVGEWVLLGSGQRKIHRTFFLSRWSGRDYALNMASCQLWAAFGAAKSWRRFSPHRAGFSEFSVSLWNHTSVCRCEIEEGFLNNWPGSAPPTLISSCIPTSVLRLEYHSFPPPASGAGGGRRAAQTLNHLTFTSCGISSSDNLTSSCETLTPDSTPPATSGPFHWTRGAGSVCLTKTEREDRQWAEEEGGGCHGKPAPFHQAGLWLAAATTEGRGFCQLETIDILLPGHAVPTKGWCSFATRSFLRFEKVVVQ